MESDSLMSTASFELSVFNGSFLRAHDEDGRINSNELDDIRREAADDTSASAGDASESGAAQCDSSAGESAGTPKSEKVSFRLWLAANVVTTVVFLLMIVGFVTFALYIATVNDMAYDIWTSRADAAAARFAAFTAAGASAEDTMRGSGPDEKSVLDFIASERASSGIEGQYRITIISPSGAAYSLPGQPELTGAVSFTSAVPTGGIIQPVAEGGEPSGWRLVLERSESDVTAPINVVSGSLLRVNVVAIIFASMAAYLIGTRMSYRIRAIIDNVIGLKRAESSEEI